jgi:cobalt transporter subunit CbtA
MAIFRRLILAALCAGLLSGIFLTVAHQIGTVPVILKAEVYERATEQAKANHMAGPQAHEHAAATWEPENGIERTAYTLLADVLTGIGFALLVTAGLTVRGSAPTWRKGVFWGLAGFAAFTIAPSVGLPPELPGTDAAPLAERQLWWLAVVVSTSSALALLAFTRRLAWAVFAAILIVLPHLAGPPQPLDHVALTSEALRHQFVDAVMVVSFLFWLVLGASTGYFCGRFQTTPPATRS